VRYFHAFGIIAALALSDVATAAADNSTVTAPSAEDLKSEAWIAIGESRFIKTCAYCHGTKGQAGKTAAFSSRKNWDPQTIFDVISEGRTNGSNVMPSWKGSIPDEDIWKIVAYIKSLSAPNSK